MVEEKSSGEKVIGPTVFAFHKINSLIRNHLDVLLLPDSNHGFPSSPQDPKKPPTSFVISKNSKNMLKNTQPLSTSSLLHGNSSSLSRRPLNSLPNNNQPKPTPKSHSPRVKIFPRTFTRFWNSFLYFLELFVCDLILASILPFITPLMLLNFLYRYLLNLFFRHWPWYKGSIRLMRGEDAFWAFESPANPGNFTSMYVIQGHANLDKIRHKLYTSWIQAKDPSTGSPLFSKLKCKAVKLSCGYFAWETYPQFNVNDHIRFLNPLNPHRPTKEDELFKEMSSKYDAILPSTKPQWEILIVPNYIYNNSHAHNSPHYAVIFRIHHSIMDGLSASQALRIIVADELVPAGVDPMKPIKSSLFLRVALYTTAFFMTGKYVIRNNYAREEGNAFWSREGLKGQKNMSWSRPIRMEAIKKMKTHTKSSISAIFSSAVGGAIRNFSIKKGHGVPRKVTAASCAALIPYPSLKAQNRFCVLFTPLPVGESDPILRVREAHEATQAGFLLAAEVVMAYWITWLGGSFPVFVNNWLQYGICQSTALLSNLPGPQKSTKIFGGDVIEDIVGWSPIRNRIGIGICLFGYNGKLRANVIADGCAFPNADDVKIFVKEFENEIRLLGEECSLTDDDCFAESRRESLNIHHLSE